MYNRLTLRIMKFFVDFIYYALPVISWICKAAFYILIALFIFVAFVIIL